MSIEPQQKSAAGLLVGGIAGLVIGLVMFGAGLATFYGGDYRYEGGQGVSVVIFIGMLLAAAGLVLLLVGLYRQLKR